VAKYDYTFPQNSCNDSKLGALVPIGEGGIENNGDADQEGGGSGPLAPQYMMESSWELPSNLETSLKQEFSF